MTPLSAHQFVGTDIAHAMLLASAAATARKPLTAMICLIRRFP